MHRAAATSLDSPENPLVSVVLATFDDATFLRRSISSVLSQTYSNIELIVVDDASSDYTVSLVRKFCNLDTRVRLVCRRTNSGRPAVPRNEGIAVCRGTYVAFLDADDWWRSRKLERQLQVLHTHPELSIVHSFLWPRRYKVDAVGARDLYPSYRKSISVETLSRGNLVQFSSSIASTESLQGLNGFDESMRLRAHEDADLWLRAARKGHFFGYIPEIHGVYQIRPDSISKDQSITSSSKQTINGSSQRLRRLQRQFRRMMEIPVVSNEYFLRGERRYRLGDAPVCVISPQNMS